MGSLDAALNQLQIVYRELVALDTVGELNSSGTTAIHLTASAIEEIRDILESHPSRLVSTCYSSSLVYDGSVGRPRYDVPI